MLAGNIPALFAGAKAVSPDLFSNDQYTKLLLHFDMPGNPTIVDCATGSSSFCAVMTVHGAAAQTAAAKKLGGGGAQFPGTNASWIDTPYFGDFDLADGDWTIDFWASVSVVNTQYSFFGMNSNAITDGYFCYTGTAGQFVFGYSTSDSVQHNVQTPTGLIPAGGFHHYAVERYGNVITLYFDGVAVATQAITLPVKAAPYAFALGQLGAWANSGINLNGSIDEFRLSVGIARFKSAFDATKLNAPYEVPLTAGNDNKTTSLLHFDGPNASTTFTDSNVGGVQAPTRWNNAGSNATLWNGACKFGTNSLLGGQHAYDRVVCGNSNDFDFIYFNFTIDFWLYRFSAAASIQVFAKRASPSAFAPFVLLESGGNLLAYMSASGTAWDMLSGVNMGPMPAVSTWAHIALVRNGRWFTYYLNGVLQGRTNVGGGQLWVNNDTITLGGDNGGGTYPGAFDEFRVSKGAARWTADSFTPPTAPYDINPPIVSPVKLLLHFDSADQSYIFFDSSPYNKQMAYLGTGCRAFKTQAKFGKCSLGNQGGANDCIVVNNTVPDQDFAFGTGDFTIDFWVYFPAIGNAGIFYDCRPNTSSNGPYPVVFHDGSPHVMFFVNGASQITSAVLTANAWHHVAVVRASGVTKLYLDGAQSGSSYTDSNNYIIDTVTRPVIGGSGNGNPSAAYIDELRVSKGVAQWTANFTPPTKPY